GRGCSIRTGVLMGASAGGAAAAAMAGLVSAGPDTATVAFGVSVREALPVGLGAGCRFAAVDADSAACGGRADGTALAEGFVFGWNGEGLSMGGSGAGAACTGGTAATAGAGLVARCTTGGAGSGVRDALDATTVKR